MSERMPMDKELYLMARWPERSVPCPRCGAEKWSPCKTPNGNPLRPHIDRRELVEVPRG